VDDGSEMFGSGTRMILRDNSLAPNGFVGLAQYDRAELGGNQDGFVTQADKAWPLLNLWLDGDFDGVCTESEMFSLDWAGLTAIRVIPRFSNGHDRDEYGNQLILWSWAYRADRRERINMVDVVFRKVTGKKASILEARRGKPLWPNLASNLRSIDKSVIKPWEVMPTREFVEMRYYKFKAARKRFIQMSKSKMPLPKGVEVEDNALDILGGLHPDLVDFKDIFLLFVSMIEGRGDKFDFQELYKKGISASDFSKLQNGSWSFEKLNELSELAKTTYYETYFQSSHAVSNKDTLEEMRRAWSNEGSPEFLKHWCIDLLETLSIPAQHVVVDYTLDRSAMAYYGFYSED